MAEIHSSARADVSSVLAGYLTRKTLAAQLNKSTRTLDRWHARRIGPPASRSAG